jgi:hypothetical protein
MISSELPFGCFQRSVFYSHFYLEIYYNNNLYFLKFIFNINDSKTLKKINLKKKTQY